MNLNDTSIKYGEHHEGLLLIYRTPCSYKYTPIYIQCIFEMV